MSAPVCNSPTHYAGCPCHEARLGDEMRALRARVAELEKELASWVEAVMKHYPAGFVFDPGAPESMVDNCLEHHAIETEAKLKASLAEAARLRLQLDTVEGWATRQPGEMPTASDKGWSTALVAAMARLAEAERERDEALIQRDYAGAVAKETAAERDEARAEVARLREENRRMGELLVEYHDALLGMVDETDPEVLAVMVAALRTLGRENEAKACEVLARWPEVKR